jgi:hypothetical protein
MDWIGQARDLYERAVFGGDRTALDDAQRHLDAVEAALAVARGRLMHARFLDGGTADAEEGRLFDAAADGFAKLGDRRGEADALFWVGCFHQVVRGDQAAARAALERSYALSVTAGDALTQSYAVRHLGFADLADGRPVDARARLEESVRLRREIGFRPGVAAGLVALAHLSADDGDLERARTLVDEADQEARASGADGILRWVDEARTRLGR